MSTTTRAMGCAAIAVLAVSTGCGSDDAADQDPEVSVPSEIAPELASEVELAGTLQLDDLTPPSDGDPWEPWDGAAAETAVASCSVADSSEASTVSEVFASSDDRGPTSVFVTAHSETLVLLTADAASEAFAQIDEDWFADCIVATSAAAHEAYAADAEADDLDEEEYSLYYGAPLEPGDVEVDEASAPDLGDESVALTAEFDVYEGEGDDNRDAAAVQAVRVGPAIVVVFTTRSGEDQQSDVVADDTEGIDDTTERLVAAVTTALGG